VVSPTPKPVKDQVLGQPGIFVMKGIGVLFQDTLNSVDRDVGESRNRGHGPIIVQAG